jgi:lipopolysaccharide export system protein LptA
MSLHAADSMPAHRSRFPLLALFAAAVIATVPVLARDSDRNQPMDIDAGRQEGTLDGNSVNVLSGGVTITQGTLDIHQRGGEVVRAVLTGSQAVLKQQMDDGSPMTAKADRIDYDMSTDVVLLTGNYTVTTPRGSTSGQRLTYDLKSGRIESGGEGAGRVKMTIQPKSTRTPAAPGKP